MRMLKKKILLVLVKVALLFSLHAQSTPFINVDVGYPESLELPADIY